MDKLDITQLGGKFRPLSERPDIGGIEVPATVSRQWHERVAIPSGDARQFQYWSAFFPRPTAETYAASEDQTKPLSLLQAEWDASAEFIKHQRQAAIDRAKNADEADAARRQAREAEKAAELEALKAELKRGYMSVPGATEADFEKDLPELLRAKRRERALAGGGKADFSGIKFLD